MQVNLPTTDITATAANAKPALTDAQKAKAHQAAQDFEAVFLNAMIKPMFDDIAGEDTAFGGSREESIYQSMMVDQISKSLASRGGIGIAKHVEKELLQLQEAK